MLPSKSRLECALCQRREWYALERKAHHSGDGPDYAILAREHYLEAHQPDLCWHCEAPFTRLGDLVDKWSRLCFHCLVKADTGGNGHERDLVERSAGRTIQ